MPKWKQCTRCGQKKDASEFNRDRHKWDSLYSYCRSCAREAYAEQSKRPGFKECRADNDLIRSLGITMKQRERLLEDQGDVCAICRAPEPGQRDWHTDHDHETGRIRGVVCSRCNTELVPAMERFMRDPELTDRVKAHLEAEGLDPVDLAWQAFIEDKDVRLLRRHGILPLFETLPE